jgi:hypothetical protein
LGKTLLLEAVGSLVMMLLLDDKRDKLLRQAQQNKIDVVFRHKLNPESLKCGSNPTVGDKKFETPNVS